jgi:hypothetical protein
MTHFIERRSDLKDTIIRPKIKTLVRKPKYLQVEKEKGK